MNNINIGDTVEILDRGGQYSSYKEWIILNAPKYAQAYCGGYAENGMVGVVVAKAQHSTYNSNMLYAVTIGDNVVIMGDRDSNEDYLKIIKTEKENNMRNFVYVNFQNSTVNYLYEVPTEVSLVEGDEVFVTTGKSKTPLHVTCVTDSFVLLDNTAKCTIELIYGESNKELQMVVGRAVPKYTNVAFN